MTKHFTLTLKAICVALVLSLALAAELLQWPPAVLASAGLAIFGVATVLQGILGSREAGRSRHGRAN